MQEQLNNINALIEEAKKLQLDSSPNFLFVALIEAKIQLKEYCKGLNIGIVDKEN